MLRYFLLSFTLLSLQNGFTQTQSTPLIIKHLIAQQKQIPVIFILYNDIKSIDILPHSEMPERLWQETQYLVHTPGKLFLGINGTGRLYRIFDNNGNLNFIREDSTFYMGNNFGAANFSIADTIYSYGGYGFWKSNGLLRYYIPLVHEWEVLKANREIEAFFGSSRFWVDYKNNFFYLAAPKIINDGLKQAGNHSETKKRQLFVLDIANGEWKESGILKNDKWVSGWEINSPWGAFISEGPFNSYLIDFINNQRLVAKKETINKLKKFYTQELAEISYFVDSTLYFGNLGSDRFDSIQLSRTDFEYKGEKVYSLTKEENESKNRNYFWVWLAAPALVLVIIFIWNKIRKRKTGSQKGIGEMKNQQTESSGSAVDSTISLKFNGSNSKQGQAFTEVEKMLIRFIYEKTVQEYTVDVEEINKVLGLSGKNEPVQKKNRNETINDINQKWSVLYGNNSHLIDRQRSEFDKRSFEYFIQPGWLKQVSEFLAT